MRYTTRRSRVICTSRGLPVPADLSARVACTIAALALFGCPSRTEGPPICSTEGIARIIDAGGDTTVLGTLCPGWRPTGAPEGNRAEADLAPWKTPPVAPSRIKTDPVSFLEKPAIIYVAIRPTDYFNFGYRNARETHFGFEIAQIEPDNKAQPLSLYGYADRRWARPFFEEVSKELEDAAGEYSFVLATLVVTYKRSRYESSPDHLEILAASRGEDRSLTPESRKLGGQDAGAERDLAPSRPPHPAAPSSGGPPEEQVLRDAKGRVLAEQAKAARMEMAWPVRGFKVLPYRVDEFEKDSVTALVEVEGGFGPQQRGTCFLNYESAGTFWKLQQVECRYR